MKFINTTKQRVWFITPWNKDPLEPGETMNLTGHVADDGVTLYVALVWIESEEDIRGNR